MGEISTRYNRLLIEKAAEKIVERAKEYTPVDTGNLEESISSRVVPDGRRKGMEIYIDESALDLAGSHKGYPYHRDIHAGYVRGVPYELGKKSKAKAASNGKNVGPLFIDRAVDDYEDDIAGRMQRSVDDAIKKNYRSR